MRIRHVVRWSFVCSGIVLGVTAIPAEAQSSTAMPGMNMSAPVDTSSSASTQGFEQADETMMKDMSAPPYTGSADKDFVTHMIPHHQGAIEMARVELKYGKDPELRKLAKNIIRAQRDEIGVMERWQSRHDGK
jgi:uncharacterized protein (DUF305 family)